MSTYLYLTAEKPTIGGWELFAPMQRDEDWETDWVPPLIVDGGWPELARHVINQTSNWGLPSDVSDEMRTFYQTCLEAPDYGVGWQMYSAMQHLRFNDRLSGEFRFRTLFSAIPSRTELRLIYWWSH